ncbi:hypothetical protein AURDEDRAFT_110305 [Auricularia subglabra TFB-10046 SS5]|nr:hypothetical protein AURDEDRAFT_110305 [Auricularia subglabra TFB-10046 SS5]
MLSRISRVRVQAAPTRFRHLRAYSKTPHASDPASPAEPGALDVDDAHLLPPDSTALGSLDEHNPIGEIARALHLPIGDELHVAETGLEPPQVIQQNAPEPTATDDALAPSPSVDPVSESEVSSAAGPATFGSERELPHDSPLGLTREPTPPEYDSRRIVVEVHNGVRHMANAFAVIRYLERTYGRVSHFNLTRSSDIEEDYRGAMFVTFKHPLSTQRIIDAGALSAHIPEPAHTIPFRPGSVGLDELQDVLTRPVEEFGGADQQALFEADARKREEQLAAAQAAAPAPEDTPADAPALEKSADTSSLESPVEEGEHEMVEVNGKMWPKSLADSLKEDHLLALMDFGASETESSWNSPSTTPSIGVQDTSAAHAQALEGNLPQLFLKIQPYHVGYDMNDSSRAFGDDFVRTRPMPNQQFAIGAGFSQFCGFAPSTPSSARMQAVLQRWRPYMPVPITSEPVVEAQPEPEPEPVQMEPISLDAIPKPRWQTRPPPLREQPALTQEQQAAATAAAAAPAVERRPQPQAKPDVQRPKKAAALEAARRAARAANERAAKEWAAQAAAVDARVVRTAQAGDAPPATSTTAGDAQTAQTAQADRDPEPQPAETQESAWRKLTSRLSSFMGGGGGGSSPRQ